ncbi:Oidioi.mRNA.OKI2018_I69.XSR.g14060.t1.cds [Oikopleura dioica]|uniref:Oidioi.mRNA.OKI2018_I69.XSR.g14060.t1.cds n=1 Tax=Oikopleura dioica TaxID=34765 RepID=A0ABN7SHF8_OIKDI|nr:Oidioi.mRNA.OKI2018_I69.XSR.g14060.t1.cds [Oikopleura dioica]
MSDTMIRNHDGRFKNIVKATDRPKSISGFFAKIFLPKDYPRSVSEDYTRYQIWDSAQALCSSVTGALAIHSVFQGIGVGDSHASSLSATTNWIVRDGIGKIVSISFAYYKGSQIDADCKRFRLFADVVNDVALTLNIISAVLPPGVRPYIYCITSCCWALVGVAGGCSRTAMTIHQARRDNASDVQAKDQSQETLVGLVGLVFSYFLVPLMRLSQIDWPQDPARCSFLCTRLKEREANPISFDNKVKFWSDIFACYCVELLALSFDIDDMKNFVQRLDENVESFVPVCLDQILEVAACKCIKKVDYEKNLSWGSWTMSIISSPVSAMSRFSPIRKKEKEFYVHIEYVEKVAEEIEETWRIQASIQSDLHILSWKEMANEENHLIRHASDVPLLCKLRKDLYCDEELQLVKIDEQPQPDEAAWPKLRALLDEQSDVAERQTQIITEKSGKLRAKIRAREDKQGQLKLLKEKKLAEKAQQMTWDRVNKLVDILDAYRSNLTNKKVIDVMNEANEGMKRVKKEMPDIEDVHKLLDDIEDHQDDLHEVQEAIARDLSSASEEELEKELNQILRNPQTHRDSLDENVDDLLKGLTISSHIPKSSPKYQYPSPYIESQLLP